MKVNKYHFCFIIILLSAITICFSPQSRNFIKASLSIDPSGIDTNTNAIIPHKDNLTLLDKWIELNSLWSVHKSNSDKRAMSGYTIRGEDGGQWINIGKNRKLSFVNANRNGKIYGYTAIANINDLLLQCEHNDELKAELITLRSMVYLWLIDAYGDIPLILESDNDITGPTRSRSVIFKFIEKSIQSALPFLKKERTYGTINYYVAQTILAKLYLNAHVYIGQDRFSDAAKACNEVINAGVYSLEPDFLTKEKNLASSENIFVVSYTETNSQGFNLSQITLNSLGQENFRIPEQPWNGYSTLEEFYNSFNENTSILSDSIVTFQKSSSSSDQKGSNFEVAFGKSGVRQDMSYPILLYSDVLLMKAESLWKIDPNSREALDLVNQVRMQSNAEPLRKLDAETLLAQRNLEFFADGWRRSDLKRFEYYNSNLPNDLIAKQ